METSLVEHNVIPLKSNLSGSPTLTPSDIEVLLPFQQQSSEDLQNELWPGGGRNWEYRAGEWRGFRKRGNYVKAYVLQMLRCDTKPHRPRVPWSLEGIWDWFPLELICSIFSLLHPIDLYHAIRATKHLRRFLLDKSFSSIWKQCFLNYPDIPFYPDDVSPPKWVSLMFGPATCDCCGVDNCLVNYASRSRTCANCQDHDYYLKDDDRLLTFIQKVIGDFPKEKDDIWPLLTQIYKPTSVEWSSGFYAFPYRDLVYIGYYIGQIKQVAREMRKYLLDIKKGVPEARENYEAYLNATKALAINHQRRSADFGRSHCRAKMALERLGYDSRDVAKALSLFNPIAQKANQSIFAMSDPILTTSKLPKYMPALEGVVCEARRRRLTPSRKKQVDVCYTEITKKLLTHPAIRHILFPCPDIIYKSHVFNDYVNDPQEEVGPLDYEIAEAEIRRILETYLSTKRCRLIKILQEKGFLACDTNEDSDIKRASELAAAVFECCGKVCVGFDEAEMHLCQTSHGAYLSRKIAIDDASTLCFSESAYQALKAIVRMLGLGLESLRSLTVTDLDAFNRRFICTKCKLFMNDGVHGLLALTWRECLDHVMEASDISGRFQKHIPVFDILSEASTSHLLAHGESSPKPSDPVWACCYCPRNMTLTKADAINHAFEVHGITNPVERRDFAFVRDEFSPKHLLNFVGLDENAYHRCLRCPPMTQKLWENKDRDLYHHLWDKHNIKSTDLVEGVDWEKVKAVEDDSWILEALKVE
ncbi:hypothetical protein BDN70DRAFT_900684 [Pholiota conissans]|uniref:F-box domain-containing protein n=1 Tax=Pholiota conissans TaxID=109636 RepID=A0A9P6CMX9_9AGAR|nr:hypothetical protein BDN70DRAFT_900684 [Pholiota conissans]